MLSGYWGIAYNNIFSNPDGKPAQEVWANFFSEYGENAVRVALSRVSFNATADEALFGVAIGKVAFYGNLVHMKKQEGKWVIVKFINHWVT